MGIFTAAQKQKKRGANEKSNVEKCHLEPKIIFF
jgi:hypothetical protein